MLAADSCGSGGVAGNFTVLHFADAKIDSPLGYFDGPLGGHMVSDDAGVVTLINRFDDLRHMALSEADSAEMLVAVPEQQHRKARPMPGLSKVTWRKSTISDAGGNCVEVALTHSIVGVRDTKNREDGMLAFTRENWVAFL